jgi:hypothetical protein
VDDEWRGCGVEALSWYVENISDQSYIPCLRFAYICENSGAAHGFVFFPIGGTPETQKALDDIETFVKERL